MPFINMPFFQQLIMAFSPIHFAAITIVILLIYSSFSALAGAKPLFILQAFLVGLLISCSGVDVNSGVSRFTFGSDFIENIEKKEMVAAFIFGAGFYYLIRLFMMRKKAFPFLRESLKTGAIIAAIFITLIVMFYVLVMLAELNEEVAVVDLTYLSLIAGLGMLYRYFRLPIIPLVYGILLGGLLEENINRAYLIARGSVSEVLYSLTSLWVIDVMLIASITIFIGAVIMRRHYESFMKVV
jgi:TctA family transporter